MTAWKDRMEPLVERARVNPFDEQTEDELLALINERLDAEGLRTKVWGAMTYVCRRCGYREAYEMEVGVEGPPDWRDDLTYIASAFVAGRCETCGGEMQHINFAADIVYEKPREQSVASVFRVPRAWVAYPTRGIYEDGTVITNRARSAFLSLNLAVVPGERTQ